MTMNNGETKSISPIKTVTLTTNLFRQPNKVGDIIDYKGKTYLIIGIQDYRVTTKTLVISFTCQSLEDTNQNYPRKAEPYSPYTLIFTRFKYDVGYLKKVKLGSLTEVKGKVYKLMEYSNIYLKGTDIHVDVLGKEIHPIDNETLKKKRMKKKMEELKIDVL